MPFVTRGSDAAEDVLAAVVVGNFITGHSLVEQLRESTIDSQRGLLGNHIVPAVGSVRIDQIRTKHFGELKRAMAAKELSGKTINNGLTVLSRMTRFWYEREGLMAPRFKAGLIKLDEKEAEFYEPPEYEALVAAAAEVGPEVHALVLLMGDAGLRQGEVCALRWDDVRWQPEPLIRLKRSRYKKKDQPGTKGRKIRSVPMTARLSAALQALPRSRRQVCVLIRESGEALTAKAVKVRLEKAEAGAGIDGTGLSHKLRHTFATRLVAQSVRLWVIKELLGHKDLTTTQRYLHMLTGAASQAIARLSLGATSQPPNHGTAHGTMMAPPPAQL
ncbi:Tyrosine recombinase XerC [Enhygromyxa salina]|uniref:Tyrosine recombinase XerC n=1 Tax=Enhygromyxa salina TaxID=215803 RepID=A0A2S9XRL1_9BACT|nr:site-specific integrase [Enhygromyxa salina]PRP95495.1 Tyrosine recombinase XerC [Enhygromyxa salina]